VKNSSEENLFGEKQVEEVDEKTLYEINEEAFENPESYRKIYAKIKENSEEGSSDAEN
jgi:hypothetical protein